MGVDFVSEQTGPPGQSRGVTIEKRDKYYSPTELLPPQLKASIRLSEFY